MSIPKINWQYIAKLKRKDGSPLISMPAPMPFVAPQSDLPKPPKRRMRRLDESKATTQTTAK